MLPATGTPTQTEGCSHSCLKYICWQEVPVAGWFALKNGSVSTSACAGRQILLAPQVMQLCLLHCVCRSQILRHFWCRHRCYCTVHLYWPWEDQGSHLAGFQSFFNHLHLEDKGYFSGCHLWQGSLLPLLQFTGHPFPLTSNMNYFICLFETGVLGFSPLPISSYWVSNSLLPSFHTDSTI